MRATISGLIEAACGYSLLVALAIPFPQPLNQRGQDYRSLSHPYSIPGVAGPGRMRDSMALSPRYLIRMRSECNWLADGRDGPGGDQRSGCCFGGGGGLAGSLLLGSSIENGWLVAGNARRSRRCGSSSSPISGPPSNETPSLLCRMPWGSCGLC